MSIWAPVNATEKGSSPFSPSACQKHLRVCLITGPLGTPYEYIHHFPPINLSPPSLTGSVARTLYVHIPHINFQRNILSICLKILNELSKQSLADIAYVMSIWKHILLDPVSASPVHLQDYFPISTFCAGASSYPASIRIVLPFRSLSYPVGCQLLNATNNH